MSDERTLIDSAAEHLPEAKARYDDKLEHLVWTTAHPNSRVSLVDMEEYLARPLRVRQHVDVETPDCFANYLHAFATEGTRVFASLRDRAVVGMIDYHARDMPSWTDHRVVYGAQLDERFAGWDRLHGKWITQREFAEFLEDAAADVVEPEPADLVEIARRFEVTRGVDFKSAVSLHSGLREFRFEEKDAVKGAIQCPRLVAVESPIFYCTEPTRYVVRLDYQIDEGKLRFRCTVHRRAELMEVAFNALVASLVGAIAPIPIHRGVVR